MMSVEYFEDIELHHKYRSEEYPLSEKEIIDFAREWNPRPMHFDPSVAEKTEMGGLFAAGAHLIAITARILPKKVPTTAIVAALAVDRLRFLTPARPGDVLILESEAISKRESKSRSNVGIVSFAQSLLNQRGELVLKYESTALVEKRPKL
jgi:acyl dehydratase